MRKLNILLIIVILWGLLPIQGSFDMTQEKPKEPLYHKIETRMPNKQVSELLSEAKATRLFLHPNLKVSYWRIPEGDIYRELMSAKMIRSIDTADQVTVGKYRFNPLTDPDPIVPTDMRQTRINGPQFWLVQFIHPGLDGWQVERKKMGLETLYVSVGQSTYLIWADNAKIRELEAMVGKPDSVIQWTGAFHHDYRISPAFEPDFEQARVSSTNPIVRANVYFYKNAIKEDPMARLVGLGAQGLRMSGRTIRAVTEGSYNTNIRYSVELPLDQLKTIAGWSDVLSIGEGDRDGTLTDESQSQIVAGNISETPNPSGGILARPISPDYLQWLADKGFPTDPDNYPLIGIADSGFDNSTLANTPTLHPDFYIQGNPQSSSRVIALTCLTDGSTNDVSGHGTLVIGTVGGYNALTNDINPANPLVEDSTGTAAGYNYGLGVLPYARMASLKIFANNQSFDLGNCVDNEGLVARLVEAGATIINHSWNSAGTQGRYTAASKAYDKLTRDGNNNPNDGNQQTLHVFAAGNNGREGSGTVEAPATAKNVLTVGSAENVRRGGTADRCESTQGSNANNIGNGSSRGPTRDGLAKPDVSVPGTILRDLPLKTRPLMGRQYAVILNISQPVKLNIRGQLVLALPPQPCQAQRL